MISQLLPIDNIFGFLTMVLPLLSFYCYTWLLGYTIREYLNELQELKKIRAEQLDA